MKKNYSFSERLCKTFLLPALLILSVAAQAQDGTSCTDAIPLPVNNSCIYEEFSITDNEAYRWFDVTATGAALRISFTEPVDTPETHIHEVSFYEDSCGSLVLLAENSRSNGDTTADGRIAPLTVLGLTPGEDYHFSVSHQTAQTATCQKCIAPAPDTSYFRLCVEEILIADAGSDKVIYWGQSIQIGNDPITGITYQWTPATGLSNTIIANPTANPDSTTTYLLTIEDTNGTVAEDSVTVFVFFPCSLTDTSGLSISEVSPSGEALWQTGKIYVKIKDNSAIDLSEFPDISLDTNNLITSTLLQYGVIFIEKPFVVLNTLVFDRTYRITFTDTANVQCFIDDLQDIDFVDYAEKVPAMYSHTVPNDPLLANQYHMPLINAFGAFDIHTGGNAIVAIVDDAVVTSHEDLAANIYTINWNFADSTPDPNPPFTGTNAVTPNNFSHGTHVAGIAGAVTDNTLGIASVGWSNKIMGVRVADQNPNSFPFSYDGLAWAAANGAHVINSSWGGTAYAQTEYNVVVTARNTYDALIIASAGNNGTSSPDYPAGYGEGTTGQTWESYDRKLVIAVGSVDSTNEISVWKGGLFPAGSNFGHWVDIVAYGTDILSTVDSAAGGVPVNNLYRTKNGTSMAAPMVAGTAGLMRSFDTSATAIEIYDCLVYSANPDIYTHPSNTLGTLGSGRLDAEAAIKCLGVSCSDDPIAVIVPSSSTICPADTLALTVNEGIAYLWSTGDTIQSIEVDQPGTYEVTVTFSGGCTANASFDLPPAITEAQVFMTESSGLLPNDGILCGEDYLQLSSFWGENYQWSFGGFTTASIPGYINMGTPPDSLNFWVEITGLGGCAGVIDTAFGTAEWLVPPTASITPDPVLICAGNSETITAAGGISYEWNTSDTTTSITVAPLSTTIYTVTVTDVNGCTDAASVTVEVFQALTLTIDTIINTTCEGNSDGAATVSVSGGNTPYSYLWSSGGTSATETGLSAGTYTLTVTDNSSCIGIINVSVGDPQLDLTFSVGHVSCVGGSDGQAGVGISGGSSPYSYNWSSGATDVVATGLAAGVYSLTVTDANLCTETATITINDPTQLTAVGVVVNDVSCPDSSDGAATVSVSGGTSPYVYNWSSGAVSDTITGLPEGTYTVTVTDDKDCTATDQVNIGISVAPAIVADFFTNQSGCTGDSVFFTNNSSPGGLTYLWDFGDGNSSTKLDAAHTYSAPGWYQVVLKATDACGNASATSQIINETPSFPGGYNDSCCSNSVSYDMTDTVITDTLEWIPGSAVLAPFFQGAGQGYLIKVSGTIRIRPGAALYIGDPSSTEPINIEFGPNGKIIVERTARLRLNGNTHFSGLAACGTMWQGVEVWGHKGMPSFQEYQGVVDIGFNSSIHDAHLGILAGRTMICFPPPCLDPPCQAVFPKCRKSGLAPNYGGGLVFISKADFSGNGIAVKLTPSDFVSGLISNIQTSRLDGGVLPDPGYQSGNSYTYPNDQNPLYGHHTSDGISPYLVYAWGTELFYMIADTLSNAQTGIELHATTGYIRSNHFDNHTYAIRSFDANDNVWGFAEIENNTFRNFQYAIWDYNGNYAQIWDNEFNPANPIAGSQSNNRIGIYLENSSNFHIYDNELTAMLNGFMVNQSGTGGGFIYRNTKQEGNVFNRVRTGIRTWGGNPALQLRCNTHNNTVAFDYSRNWVNQNKLASQGKFNPNDPNNDVNPAGNEFNPLNPSVRKEISNVGSKYIIGGQFIGLPLSPYTYFRHNSSGLGGISVIPDPTDPLAVWMYNNDVPKTITSCEPCFSCKTQQFLDDKAAELVTLRQEQNSREAALDGGGNTAALLGAVDSYRNNGQLKDLLLAYSPLSDTVLLAYLDREQVPAGHYKEVLIPNSPVSDKVIHPLIEKLETLPGGITDQIREVQAFNPDYRTVTAIGREMEAVHMERQFAFSGMISDSLRSVDSLPGNIQGAINMLEAENTIEADMILAGTYLKSGEFSLAQAKINAIPVNDQEIQDWATLQNMLLQLAVDTLTVFDMDSIQEAFVRQLANQYPEYPAVTQAKSILRLVFGEDFPIILPEEPGTNKKGETPSTRGQDKDSLTAIRYLAPNYPDPFQSITYIPYYVPETVEKAVLNIFSASGKLVKSRLLERGNNIYMLEISGWADGLYFYTIQMDGTIRQVEKMILTR